MNRILSLAACAVLLCGCTVTRYTSATGEKFSRWSLGSRASVGELAVGADTNGVRSLTIKGYSNDHVEAAAATTAAAVRAALGK